jgi:hypothetical protein
MKGTPMRRHPAVGLAVFLAALQAGCAVPPVTDRPAGTEMESPSLGLFSRIRVPDGQDVVLRLTAKGAQVFRCERVEKTFEWRFRQPDAELFNAEGKPVGRHGANFSFEHRDGSRLIGTVKAHDKAPTPDTLPWLLFSTRSFGKGELSGITYVQRIDTLGGMPPPGCTAQEANRLLRVEFSAVFVFYRPRS